MSKYYIFCNGRILLKNGGSELPDTESDKELELLFKASGNVDREDPDGDIWAEIDPASELPEVCASGEKVDMANL